MKYTPIAILIVALIAALGILFSQPRPARAQSTSILSSKHNLSASGPGDIRAVSERDPCIFCHTPHNSSPITPLWNRSTPVSTYTPYTSNSLQSKPGQPTGSSKLCLSCHDGTIALGSVLSRDETIQMAGGMTTLPPGHVANIGTDLSDDHPISFKFDQALVDKNPKLTNPKGLPPAVRLDSNGELQCTTCHDAHNNVYGNFLVMNNTSSQLCNTCHRAGTTTIAEHSQCVSCHQSHTAPSGPYLLTRKTVTDTCLNCHGGNLGAAGITQGLNVAADVNKISKHDTRSPVNQTAHAPNGIVCNDCHEAHTMTTQGATAPRASGMLGAVSGINTAGAAVPAAQNEYEVCFKCHADQPASGVRVISRKATQVNKRLQFAQSAVSYHPVTTAGRNQNVPSLLPPMTTASMLYCTDCHASDTSKRAGGSGPNGPHGSSFSPLLIAQYSTLDNTPESPQAYALCYRCHDRNNILGNNSFSGHKLHISPNATVPPTPNTPCSVCHDSHGISSTQGTPTDNACLINFDTSIVQPDPITGQILFKKDPSSFSGTCLLSCHGVAHSPKSYGPTPPDVSLLVQRSLRSLRSKGSLHAPTPSNRPAPGARPAPLMPSPKPAAPRQ